MLLINCYYCNSSIYDNDLIDLPDGWQWIHEPDEDAPVYQCPECNNPFGNKELEMPLVASNTDQDTGLSYYATCDCSDFTYRHEGFPKMAQEQPRETIQRKINSRWLKAYNTLSIEGIWQNGDTWGAKVAGSSEVHGVFVCKSVDDPGPNFMCKHIMATLRLLLKEIDGLEVVAFGCPDTDIPTWGEAVSVDGWMVALIKRKEENDN